MKWLFAKSRGGKLHGSAYALFHSEWYLETNPDVAAAGADPLRHYVAFGWKEGRSPHPLFDLQWYLETNPDVAAAGVEPLRHYAEHGWKEGRNPHPLFNSKWYLEQNPDVATSGMEPLRHYAQFGWKEGRSPNVLFDVQWYLKNNPQVAVRGLEPLAHYAQLGWKEDASPHPWVRKYASVKSRRDSLLEYQRIVNAGAPLPMHPGFTAAWKDDYFLHTSDRDLQVRTDRIPGAPERMREALEFAALTPNISIGIILYHTPEPELLRMVRVLNQAARVAAETGFASAEIVLADNSQQWSQDDIGRIANAADTVLHFVPTVENVGFGRGHNHLMRHAFGTLGATHYFCLNPDGYLHPNALTELYKAILFHKLPALIEARQFPSEHPKDYDAETIETNWNSAGCLIIPRFLFDLTGGFDERFFMYCEDVDLSWRVWGSGYRCLVAPNALFHHHVAGRKHSLVAERQSLESGRILAEKWGVPRFRLICERLLIERGHYESVERLPPLPSGADSEPHSRVDFTNMFGFAPFRW